MRLLNDLAVACDGLTEGVTIALPRIRFFARSLKIGVRKKCVRFSMILRWRFVMGLQEGVTIALPRALYETEYRGGYVPKGMRLDSQHGVCFRACMYRHCCPVKYGAPVFNDMILNAVLAI